MDPNEDGDQLRRNSFIAMEQEETMRFTFRHLALMCVVAVAGQVNAEEGDMKNRLTQWGLSGLKVVTDAEAMQVRGQGYTFSATRSASSIPGTFTHNFASALGDNFTNATSGAESNLDYFVNDAFRNAEFDYGLGFEHFDHMPGDSGWGPWLTSEHDHHVSVGAHGFAVSSRE